MARMRQPAPLSVVNANPSAGDVFFNTDDDTLYYYDGTRAKWLSTCLRFAHFAHTAAVALNGYIDPFGTVVSGHSVIPVDATIVGYSVAFDVNTYNATTARQWKILRNGVQIGSTITEPASKYTDTDMTLDVDCDATASTQRGLEIQVTTQGNTNPAVSHIDIYWRARAA